MAPGEAADIGLSGCWAGMSEYKSGTAFDDASCTQWVRGAFFDFGGSYDRFLYSAMLRAGSPATF